MEHDDDAKRQLKKKQKKSYSLPHIITEPMNLCAWMDFPLMFKGTLCNFSTLK